MSGGAEPAGRARFESMPTLGNTPASLSARLDKLLSRASIVHYADFEYEQ